MNQKQRDLIISRRLGQDLEDIRRIFKELKVAQKLEARRRKEKIEGLPWIPSMGEDVRSISSIVSGIYGLLPVKRSRQQEGIYSKASAILNEASAIIRDEKRKARKEVRQ